MKILIFGYTNWIANEFIEYIKINNKEINIIKTNININNETLVENILLLHSPTHIINFIDNDIENDYEINNNENNNLNIFYNNIKDNLYSPLVLAILSNKYKIHYTYIGSGNIYINNNIEYKFLENDNPNNFNSKYIIIKGITDKLLRLYKNNILNLRIKMPIINNNDKNNYIIKLINSKYINSKPNSITILNDMFPIILDMMNKKIIGTINLTNPGIITDNEILEIYKEIIKPELEWIKIEDNENYINNVLDTNKLLKLYPNIPNIKDSIKDIIKNMNK
jgi:dTDP-4-dehydrorhamnose reductase